jgi:DNA-binding PadR family transcriptional regulator
MNIKTKIIGAAPLTEATFYILISLVEPLHGYGIMQNTEKMSDGRVTLGPGTLYGALNSLMDKKLILPFKMNKDAGSRRKLYQLTDLGRQVINLELLRLEEMLRNGYKQMKKGE